MNLSSPSKPSSPGIAREMLAATSFWRSGRPARTKPVTDRARSISGNSDRNA
jgi:hypothetical protein